MPGRPQLGAPLTVRGRARAYAGQATDGAKVSYHITRRELWPLFAYGFGGRGNSGPARAAAARKLPTAPPLPMPRGALRSPSRRRWWRRPAGRRLGAGLRL
ncbi:MAG: hypothetical protein WKG07_27245 [Hymenobacter sp.]